MDCNTARLLLAFSRSELDDSAGEGLNNHLADCTECGALAREEHQADRLLGAAMRQVRVPADLRQRLVERLQTERKVWYKRLPQRHPRVAAGVAAVLLLTVGLTVYAAIRPPRPLNLGDIAERWNSRLPEEMQKWF